MIWNKVVHYLKIDDPVDAIPVHFGCGFLGTNMVGWFDRNTGILYGYGAKQWGIQLLGAVSFFGWSFGLHIVICFFLKICNVLRVSETVEIQGYDATICGGMAQAYESLP